MALAWSLKRVATGPPIQRRLFSRFSGGWGGRHRVGSAQTTPVAETEQDIILHRTLRPGSSLMRCTVFDSKGKTRVVNGEYKRSQLLSEYGLLPRDLRKIDVSANNIVPALLVREKSILVHLLHIRALIKPDTVLLFDNHSEGESKARAMFLYDLGHRLQSHNSSLPYELRALETVLISVVTTLDAELQVNTQLVNDTLSELEHRIEREELRHLLVQSKQMSAFIQKATLIREALSDLIDNEEDLDALYLTAKQEGKVVEDHSTAEIMLESYYNYCDEIVQAAETLESNIKSTEEVINIVLDANRNTLMSLELKFQIGMLGLGAGSMLAALYGMNLKNFIEDTNWGFATVSISLGVVSVLIVAFFLRRLGRLQRVQMKLNTNTGAKRLPGR